MANPTASFPTTAHTATDVSGYAATALGASTVSHTQLEGKQEAELEAITNRLLGGFVNVMEYGAVGNGVADDTSAIQAALANEFVYFPPKVFLVTDTLEVDHPIWIRGPGRTVGSTIAARLLCTTAGKTVLYCHGATTNISNLSIGGSAEGDQTLCMIGDNSTWHNDGLLSNVWFAGGGVGLALYLGSNYTLQNCVFDGIETIGCYLEGAPLFNMRGCVVYDCEDTGVYIASNAAWDDNVNHTMTFEGNLFERIAGTLSDHDPTYSGMTHANAGIYIHDGRAINITGNQFWHNYQGATGLGGHNFTVQDINLTGNTFSGHKGISALFTTANRVNMSACQFVPYYDDSVTEVAAGAYHILFESSTRCLVTNTTLVGNATRVVGIGLDADTSLSGADNILHQGFAAEANVVYDVSETNTIGTLYGDY